MHTFRRLVKPCCHRRGEPTTTSTFDAHGSAPTRASAISCEAGSSASSEAVEAASSWTPTSAWCSRTRRCFPSDNSRGRSTCSMCRTRVIFRRSSVKVRSKVLHLRRPGVDLLLQPVHRRAAVSRKRPWRATRRRDRQSQRWQRACRWRGAPCSDQLRRPRHGQRRQPGFLLTPGFTVYFMDKYRLGANLDVCSPEVGDTELSLKAQSLRCSSESRGPLYRHSFCSSSSAALPGQRSAYGISTSGSSTVFSKSCRSFPASCR